MGPAHLDPLGLLTRRPGSFGPMAKIHGGQIVARALRAEGVDAIFTLTGGHIVPILDGCVQEGIRVVDVRHEQAAAHAAEAYTRLTGRLGWPRSPPAPASPTPSPGWPPPGTHRRRCCFSAAAISSARSSRGGLQEMDHPRLFGAITAWSGTCWQVERLADHIAVAAPRLRRSGAPVFLDIPMDVQFDMVEETAVSWPARYRATEPSGVDPSTLDQMVALLHSQRPMVFAGVVCGGPRRGA